MERKVTDWEVEGELNVVLLFFWLEEDCDGLSDEVVHGPPPIFTTDSAIYKDSVHATKN